MCNQQGHHPGGGALPQPKRRQGPPLRLQRRGLIADARPPPVVATAPHRADGEGSISKVIVQYLLCTSRPSKGQNKHSVGDFGTCSVGTVVHKTECILHHSLLNRPLSTRRWFHVLWRHCTL